MINESGKNTRLSKKYRMKLWPLRAATRVGQNAMAIQMIKPIRPQATHMVVLPSAARCQPAVMMLRQRAGRIRRMG